MPKELFVDCRKTDLGEAAKLYGATGVIGETKVEGLKVLNRYQTVTLNPGEYMDGVLRKFSELSGKVEYVILETATGDWTTIPRENAIAASQHYSLKTAAKVRSVEEAKLAFATLQVGVDAVIVDEEDIIQDICKYINQPPEKINLVDAKITKVKPNGHASRICVDTTSELYNLEGVLVGHQAEGLFLIESESYKTPHVDPRIFRVNAGPVDEYILVPGGKTKYLSELKSNDEVCAVDKDGNVRVVVVGRIKQEPRPMVYLEAEHDGKIFTAHVQNAETIRLVGNESIPLTDLLVLSESELKQRDISVKLRRGPPARHYGIETKTDVKEK